jgi:hypothetical protein
MSKFSDFVDRIYLIWIFTVIAIASYAISAYNE